MIDFVTYLLTSTLFEKDCMRSADTRTLLVSRTRTNLGDRAFSTSSLELYLPTDLR